MSTKNILVPAIPNFSTASKTINPGNQRVTTVELSDKGVETVAAIKRGRAERFRVLIRALAMEAREYELLKSIVARAVDHFDRQLGLAKS